MALTPINEVHALQIQAGILGRKAGHSFESDLTASINKLAYPLDVLPLGNAHVLQGDPARLLLQYVAAHLGSKKILKATALSTGALATSEAGKQWLSINGATVSRCKSDLVLSLSTDDGRQLTIGVSTKQCNQKKSTNAQLYLTTALGFVSLLRSNRIHVTDLAVGALRQFCGDSGFRPADDAATLKGRLVDPRRFFWEELGAKGRQEWEHLLATYQDEITRLLLQKAYLNDPFVPEYLIHKTKRAGSWDMTEVAVYSIDELVALSRAYEGFVTKPYVVRKGT